MRTTLLALLGTCAAVLHAQVGATVQLPSYATHGELWKRVQAQNQQLFQANVANNAALWFTQRVDHFAADGESERLAQATNATFQQRYYEMNSFWRKPDGPVILYIGGEGPLTGTPAGFVHVLAEKFGAKILALEHRFYGESVPNGNLETSNYRFLTVQQALADLKHFREAYQQTLPGAGNQWIAVGGSYPGALAAWFRVAYPDTTVAALSSSGVVEPVYNFYAFDEQVALSAGAACANVLRQTTAAFEAQIRSGNGTQVKALLGAAALGDTDFHYMIADAAAMAVQYGHKDVLCGHMVGAFERNQSLTEQFANFTITMYGAAFGSGCFYDTNCLVRDRSRWADGLRSWRWQKCSQLAYFQVAPATHSLRAGIVDLAYHEAQCRAVFGDIVDPAAGVAAITQLYGGAHPRGHRIFFSNGGDDPWQRASVLASLSDDEVANVAQCDLCGHCGDLRADPDSPEPLKKQREQILHYLGKWLAESVVAPSVEQQQQAAAAVQRDAVAGAEDDYRSTPLVLVPIVVAFVALVVVLHKDIVRDSRSRSGYARLVDV
ncbi:hypothetical protein PybrP1_003504 [[Pythium] brassicae (nom. inval.)]|nr:hypothetical protein PybrP1_003504 [[Pythium] brassicae (nom. inval.)]